MPVPSFIPKPNGYDVELQLYTQVLKLESLHWGYWKDIKELNVENLKKAQGAYTTKLLSLVPKGVKNVLDVGAGIGDNAIRFAQKGYRVTALTPEPNQIKVFKDLSKKHKNISYIQSRYEDFISSKQFDLILMSESSNYFPLKSGLEQTAKYLKPGGYLLLAGLFRKNRSKVFPTWNVISDFEKQAAGVGLKVRIKEDISNDTAPSMQLGYDFYKAYGEPAINILSEYYKKAFGWKAFFISLFFRKELKILKYIIEQDLPNRLDVKRFKKYGRYLIYLYQKTALPY